MGFGSPANAGRPLKVRPAFILEAGQAGARVRLSYEIACKGGAFAYPVLPLTAEHRDYRSQVKRNNTLGAP